MDENQILKNPAPADQPFVKKQIETPILDSQLKQSLAPSVAAGGFKEFYRANKFYFWAIAAGVIIIGTLSYFAFRKAPATAPKEANVSISVDVPQTVPSGGEAVYKITLQNNDSQKLVNLELELAYPDGVAFENSTPQPENISGSLFKVPDLISGQNAVVFVKAKASGNVNDQKTLNIKLHYHYANFNSEFVKQQTAVITLVASNVIIELNGPTTANNAQLVIYSVKYQNNSDSDITSARVKLSYPDGFNFAQSTPPPDLGSDTWNIAKLAKGASAQIQIQGTFSSTSPGESKTANADFLILGPTGAFFIQNSSSFITAISSLPLLVTQDLLPQNPNNVINPGDSLTFNIRYQNNGTTVATGVNVAVTLDSKVINLSSIRAEGGQVNNNTISWNASGVPQLASLAPNESGQLSFSLKINNPAIKDSSKNLSLVSNIKIQSTEYQTAFPGNQLTLKVSSPVSVTSSVSYVSGKLPPQVGQQTVYKIKFSLTNSSNDFASGLLTAFIPLGSGGYVAGSASVAESANVQFDSSTGKLTWNVGSLPANVGRFTPPRVLEFQVALNPSASQAFTSPSLVKNINFTAKDNYTGQDVSAKGDDLSTADIPSNNGFSNGQVQP